MLAKLYFLIRSYYYAVLYSFVRKEVDVVFYYPHHFNRFEGKNYFFRNLVKACQEKGLRYLLLEEPDYNSKMKRSNEAISFDFVFILLMLLRKFFFKKLSFSDKDLEIVRYIKIFFFRRLKAKNVITISQSKINFLKAFFPKSKLFDLQHGIIHSKNQNYISNNNASNNITDNNVNLLLFGRKYYDILLKSDNSGYYKSNAHVIGWGASDNLKTNHSFFNKKIVVTLQITADHSKEENKLILKELYDVISKNKDFFIQHNINFYIKHHPRYNNEVSVRKLLGFDFVFLTDKNITECAKICSLHITNYSTCTMDFASFGIPTIFLNSLKSKTDVFLKEFNCHVDKESVFLEIESMFLSNISYQERSKYFFNWGKGFLDDFNKNNFIKLLS